MRSRLAFAVLLVATALLLPSWARAQGDGPRAYLFLPKDTNVALFWYMNLNGNVDATGSIKLPNAVVDTNLFIMNYHRTFSLGGHYALFQFVQPMGKVTGEVVLPNQTLRARDASGLSDTILTTSVALAGAPALAPQDYVKYPFRASVTALFSVGLPTGSYESTRLLNLGTNRWSFRIGAPIYVGIGDWKFGKRTTFEVHPSVYFYTDNNDITGGESKSQDPLFSLELHLTRDLNRAMWASFDTRYFAGGSTSVDGVSDENPQTGLGLGGTFGMALSPSISLQASYGERVASSTKGFETRMIRARFIVAF